MDISSTALMIFVIITVLYFIFLYFLDKKFSNGITIIYYLLVIISQLLLVYKQTQTICKSGQIGTTFIWGLIPWFVVFFGLNVALRVFPSWKAPFSNTFGYLVTYLMGIRSTFNSMLKSNYKTDDAGVNKVMQDIFQDQSILINEMTPKNFDTAISKLSSILNTKAEGFQDNMEKLKKLVYLKDEVSRFIWYLLTGGLVISMSNMGVISAKCSKSLTQMDKEMTEYQEAIQKQAENEKNKKPMNYIVRE